jgi:hypothetical protein
MRVSRHFKLGVGQDVLDFVDIDIKGDDPLYVDPRALRTLNTPWTNECVTLVQDFFQTVLGAIRNGETTRARLLLRQLREPNETHLGLSRRRARGRALGPQSARDVADALLGSEAIKSGLLEDLEETILMIDGIGSDLISDMTTNVMREPLIHFTQAQARQWAIPLRSVDSGPIWAPSAHDWTQRFEELPVVKGSKLLFVPKAIVRKQLQYRPQDYFQHYILNYLVEQEKSANSELVYLLKDGTPRVDKQDVVRKYGRSKRLAAQITKQDPTVLARYRRDKRRAGSPALSHEEISEQTPGTTTPDWDALLEAVTSVPAGRAGADSFHRSIEDLLKVLFYPQLAFPEREVEIHGGRKRIDLTFANQGLGGFFGWISRHQPAMYIVIECKNYTGDPANPELDQISGRFSPSRGKVGLLVCRSFKDKDLFVERCRDTASDQRGFVLPIDDADLTVLIGARRDGELEAVNGFLKDRFDRLVR